MNIDAEKIAQTLRETADMVSRLKGDLAGVAVICPPGGDPMSFVLAGTELTPKQFFGIVAEKLGERQAQATGGGSPAIGFPR